MRIELPDGYILNSDSQNYWLSKRVKSKNGKMTDRRVSGYHWTLSEAVQSMIDRRIGESEATTLNKLLKELKTLEKLIRDMGEVVRKEA